MTHLNRSEDSRFRTAFGYPWLVTGWGMGNVVALFLSAPPHEASWDRLAQFVATVMIAPILIFFCRFRNRRHALKWCIVAAILTAASLLLFMKYTVECGKWTREYRGKRFVIGDEYQQPVLEYLKEMDKESESSVDLVKAFEGDPDKVWTPESRARIAVWLGWLYLACGPLVCSALVCIAHAIRIGVSGKRNRLTE